MIKAVIVDDEQHCINWLNDALKNHQNEVIVTNIFSSVDEALTFLKKSQPDLLFLDVQILEKTGFDLLKSLENISFEVIFTTAHVRFAIDAFRFSAVDYLLKPIDQDDLKVAIEKVSEKLKTKDFSSKVDILLANAQISNNKKLTIPTSEGFIFQEISNIIRCQSEGNYTHIFIKNLNQPILVSKTLKFFDELLSSNGFFRIHNSHLINLDYISKYTKGKGGYVTMTDNTKLEVSIRRKEDFLKAIN